MVCASSQNLKAMECANSGFNLHLASAPTPPFCARHLFPLSDVARVCRLYDRPFNNSMNAKKTKLSGTNLHSSSLTQ